MNITILIDNNYYEIDIFNILKFIILVSILISDSNLLLDYLVESLTKYTILMISISMLLIGSSILYFDIILGIISIFLSGNLFTLFIILNRF